MIYSGDYGRYSVPEELLPLVQRDENEQICELPANTAFWIWVNQQEIKASHELLLKAFQSHDHEHNL